MISFTFQYPNNAWLATVLCIHFLGIKLQNDVIFTNAVTNLHMYLLNLQEVRELDSVLTIIT